MLNELLARELFNHATFAVVLHEAVVLLGCAFRQGLEPMRAMRCAEFHRPFLHACCHSIGSRHIERRSAIDDVAHLLINIRGQVVLHLLPVEDIFGKELAWTLLAVGHFDGPFLERLADYLKPKCAGHLIYLLFDDLLFTI